MASSIYHNARTERQYKAATGLSIAEFEALYEFFQQLYRPKAVLIQGPTQPILTDKKEALFFILHYYKAYPTLQNLGMYFGISDAAASQYLELLKPCLKTALRQQHVLAKRLFTGQTSFEQVFAGVEDLFIDVTEVPIERSAKQEVQRKQYSGKKNSIR
ncbi:transposase family protein [Hymenobacter sp. PAMC 26628]|uniref:transposase family protein n=1 Tax=Hymenobacter sp. PAMC 26628 TaxID=1484118 RepID=UPI000770026A|nr:transposase family protein [Hymenobacter sp. PAMC 26628]AMJ66525.1 hypothetical protein AXW84_14610 [Hymenobacter sp. PAMC 26628]AMJ67454.1 hypothetical protein AXW84_20010 [Hymenobacter sp. PAMC 26628]